MIVLVSRKRQPVPLDRVGDHACGNIILKLVKSIVKHSYVVSCKISHRSVEFIVAVTANELSYLVSGIEIILQFGTPGFPPLEDECGIEGSLDRRRSTSLDGPFHQVL